MPKLHPTTRDNFLWLLIALVALLFSSALFDQLFDGAGARIVNLSITTTLLVAVWSLDHRRRRHLSRFGISIVLLAIAIGDILLVNAELNSIILLLILLFLCSTIVIAARQVLFTGNIDGNKIVGAIVIYLLIGLSWAFVYLLVEELFPGSINGLNHASWQDNLDTVIYYSFVTLTALGYGDITPAMPLSRFLAYTEAVVGQFYLAILVASLIGARLRSKKT
ncbi:MAG: potassium channel family protein [Halioglobus sp.]